MNEPTPEEEGMMEAVALAPEETTTEEEKEEEEEEEPVQDPFALPEETTTEEPQEPPPTDTQKALNSLRQSSIRLGSAIHSTATELDTKVGLTKTVGAMDEKTRASQTLKSATMALGGWLSSVDSQLGVSQKTAELGHTFKERVVEPMKPVVEKSTRKLYEVDEQHGITRSTASTLAKGADLLTSSLVGSKPAAPEPKPRDDEPS